MAKYANLGYFEPEVYDITCHDRLCPLDGLKSLSTNTHALVVLSESM